MKKTAATPSYIPLDLLSPKRLTRPPDLKPSPHATHSRASTPPRLKLTTKIIPPLNLTTCPNNNIMLPRLPIFSLPHTNLSRSTPRSLSINIPLKVLGSSGPPSTRNLSLPTTTTRRTKVVILGTSTSQVQPGRSRNGERSRNALSRRPG
jgi:hypothetical protein